ncbi:MAG: YfiR family protein [Proteobacteria bacterium]|nr:YfiR family protein [Pseudomonadota bacterium]
MESKLKAAFIYNFAKFVEWPASTDNAATNQLFVIGILGYNQVAKELMAIEDKTVKGKKLSVKTLSNTKQMRDCHVIFISASEQNNLTGILTTIKHKEILTISDMINFTEKGGIIGLVKVENKIRFDINLKAAEESGLKIRSDLLSLAREINH